MGHHADSRDLFFLALPDELRALDPADPVAEAVGLVVAAGEAYLAVAVGVDLVVVGAAGPVVVAAAAAEEARILPRRCLGRVAGVSSAERRPGLIAH